ncbi:MAG: CDP-alcohol phosphatidyltransferase family protein [Asgard group archaeon]|nr:CDP-alcohol phosphatidyltransferase family protein [Asgard group archaeon]
MNWWRNFKLKTRNFYKKIFEPIGVFLGKLGFTPNMVSLSSGLFAIATAIMYSLQGRITSFDFWWLIGFALMIFTSFLDMVDGSIARATKNTSNFGKVLDPVMDRFAELCFVIGIAIGNYTFEPIASLWAPIATIPIGAWCLFCFAGMIFASYVRGKAESVNHMTVESVGIMERREKLALLYLGNLLYFWYPVALIFAIILIGFLSFITTFQRMFYIRKIMVENEEPTNKQSTNQ